MLAVDGLLADLQAALESAEPHRRIVSVTAPVDLDDPTAAVFASRLASDRWFCWEQPDRDGFALATLGSVHEIVSRGPGRFDEVSAELARVGRGAISHGADAAPAGAGPLGGRLRLRGRRRLDPALVLAAPRAAGAARTQPRARRRRDLPDPERDRRRRRDRSARPPRAPAAVAARRARCRCSTRARPGGGDRQRPAAAPLRGGCRRRRRAHPRRRARQGGAGPRGHGRGARARTIRRRCSAPCASSSPSCFCFCVGTPEAAFLGASPELLVRRRGAGVATVALAGSTRRSADPAVDDHLGEQLMQSEKNRVEHRIVARRIARKLRRARCGSRPRTSRGDQGGQHPAPGDARARTARRAASAIELAGLLHPTPAVGGEPDAGPRR